MWLAAHFSLQTNAESGFQPPVSKSVQCFRLHVLYSPGPSPRPHALILRVLLLRRRPITAAALGSFGRRCRAKASSGTSFAPFCASLSPNPWSRPSQPGCPIKVKTTSGKQEQWNGDNLVFVMLAFMKEISFFFQWHGDLETFRDIFCTGWEYFSVFFSCSRCCSRLCFHIQPRFSSILEGVMVLLFQVYYPNHGQYATG